jgi:hypothetical protein
MGDVIYLDRIRAKLTLLQNIGWWDRAVRFIAGTAVGAYGIFIALQGEAIWPTVAILVSIYPVITAMVGWDPLYQFFNARTCGRRCGPLPFEMNTVFKQRTKRGTRLATKKHAHRPWSRRSKPD